MGYTENLTVACTAVHQTLFHNLKSQPREPLTYLKGDPNMSFLL